jgi:hypothetical protein
MKTPKKVLVAIRKHKRRIEKTLKLARVGGRLRGETKFSVLNDFATFTQIARLLQKNRIRTAVSVYDNVLVLGMPVIVRRWLDKLSLAQ